MIIIDILEYYYTQHGPVSSRYRYCTAVTPRVKDQNKKGPEPLVVVCRSVNEELV